MVLNLATASLDDYPACTHHDAPSFMIQRPQIRTLFIHTMGNRVNLRTSLELMTKGLARRRCGKTTNKTISVGRPRAEEVVIASAVVCGPRVLQSQSQTAV